MVRLLHACARSLRERGMIGIYADGLKVNDYNLEALGAFPLSRTSKD